MNEEKEESMFIDPEILQKELVISLPVLNESDIELMINGADTSSEYSSSIDERENEKHCVKRDQRRLNLLNDPNYGIILSFLDRFRSYLNVKKYPLKIFEDNLISEQEKMSRRFIDFHLALFKKVSKSKNTERNQFIESMTKFANHFNRHDGDHLKEFGYPKAKIETKLRLLKTLLEKQFDRNHTLKTALTQKSASDIRHKPFGRDRFGGSYWLFMDTDCFIRVFREDTDANRTWINVVKNRQELENLIKLLITDYLVRKKFPDWKFSYESLNSLSSSHEFEERYGTNLSDNKKGNPSTPSFVQYRSGFIKTEDIDLDPIVNLDRDLSLSPPGSTSSSSFMINNVKKRNILDSKSDQESINSVIINGKRLYSSSSSETREEINSPGCTQHSNNSQTQFDNFPKMINIAPKIDNNEVQVILSKPATEQGLKRKLVDYDDSESESENSEKNDETSQDLHQIPVNIVSKPNEDLPIALRRSRRRNRGHLGELSPDDSSSTGKSLSDSASIRKKSINKKLKGPKSSRRRQQQRRRRRRGKSSINGFSSTTSDERLPTDDSEDYYPDNQEADNLLNGNLIEEEEDDGDDYTPQRKAKTVAECHEKFQISYKPCSICSQTDRPELLLLCENCNDAYHLECVRPELISIPDDDWFCPLCEHKYLCEKLIEKLHIIIKDEQNFEMKRRLNVSKRRKRLINVTVNVDRYVGQSPPAKRPTHRFISSDETASEKKRNSTDDDVDSVYGAKKNDENRKPSDHDQQEQEGKRRVRSCRKKAQNYSFDEYDKRIKDAIVDAGVHKTLIENDSDDSDEILMKKTATKKRTRYELDDDDFNMSDGKNDGDFLPSRPKPINGNDKSQPKQTIAKDDDDTESYEFDNNYDIDDIGMSDEDSIWRNRRQSSASSISKKKPAAKKPKRNYRKKSTVRSEDDSTISEATNLSSATSITKIKSEPTIPSDLNGFLINGISKTEFDPTQPPKSVPGNIEGVKYTFNKNQVGIGNETKQRPKRATTTKKKPVVHQEVVDDEEEKDRPLPKKRVRAKKRLGDQDSSLEDDDDYEKSVHKRRLFNHGRVVSRKSILGHIKKLVGDDDEEEEENGSPKDKNSDETNKDDNNNTKQKKTTAEYEEVQLSDDDDFPDEEEILKTTGLINAKTPVTASKPVVAGMRPPFVPPAPTYQFIMADPTAHFDFTCQPEAPITEPSDSNQTNGDNNPPTTS